MASGAGTGDPAGSTSPAQPLPAPSVKVRKILRLEARAHRLLARYERALATTARTMREARALLDDAQVLESSLTGAQLSELRRGRGAAIATAASPPGATGPHSTTTAG